MRVLNRLALSFAFLVLWNWSGHAQSSITTYVGPSLAVGGLQATTQTIGIPDGVSADGAGGFYVSSSSQNRVYRVTSHGTLRVIAGTGKRGVSGDGGPASSAQLKYPHGVAVDGTGNVFIADSNNNRIRMLTAGGVITTVAGEGTAGFSGDGGPALAAQLKYPVGVAVDGAGNLFIADRYNNRIRKVTPDGIISTLTGGRSGFSGDGGPAASAQINDPRGVAVDRSGNVFIADAGNERIRVVTPDGIMNTVAGSGPGFGGDGGAATSAELNYPGGAAVDAAGNVFIADTRNHRIRKVTPGGIITTIAGNGATGFGGDGGPATSAQLSYP